MMPANTSDISQRVRELRSRTGLTQEQFAHRLGVVFPTVNRLENGHMRPSRLAQIQIDRLARELDEKVRDLLEPDSAAKE